MFPANKTKVNCVTTLTTHAKDRTVTVSDQLFYELMYNSSQNVTKNS